MDSAKLAPEVINLDILESLKRAYADMRRMDLAGLDRLYADDVIFRDPVTTIRGLPALQDYLAASVSDVPECRFEYLDQLSDAGSAYLKWIMHFRHPRLAGGEMIHVRGISHLQFNERIYFHEDSYDMGQLLYEHVPLLGGLNRWLKSRIAS